MFAITDIPIFARCMPDILKICKMQSKAYVFAMYIIIYESTDVLQLVQPNEDDITTNDDYLQAIALLMGAAKLSTNDSEVWTQAYKRSMLFAHYVFRKHIRTMREMPESMYNEIHLMVQMFLQKYCISSSNITLNTYEEERAGALQALEHVPNGEKKDKLILVIKNYGRLAKPSKSFCTIVALNIHIPNMITAIKQLIPDIDKFEDVQTMFDKITDYMDDKITDYMD